MNRYVPRRCSARWLDGDCPEGVLAILDHPDYFDRYTVFYAEPIATDGTLRNTHIWFRGMSEDPTAPQGFGIAADMPAYQVAEYRYRNKHRYCRWTDLPAKVQETVRRDLEEYTP